MFGIEFKNKAGNEALTGRSVIGREIFYFFSVLLLVFIILEIIWPNIILVYFNLNWLLIPWLIFGLIL
ncbi:MAG: hypothetical protein WC458_01215 [Patescibacteria group bacterium]